MSHRIDYTIPLAAAIEAGDSFTAKGGARLSGDPGDGAFFGSGRLSMAADLERFRAEAATMTYVVYSYATPIAWRNAEGAWYVTIERFSVTTDRHRGMVRRALVSLGVEV